MKLTKETSKQIADHAAAEIPNEICGFVIQDGRKQRYIPFENVSPNPKESFELSPDAWLDAEKQGKILAVVHSHPDGYPFLSGADRQIQVSTNLPWVLCTSEGVRVIPCVPHLRGRTFEYGVRDCLAVLRDAYLLCGIELPNPERTTVEADAQADRFISEGTPNGFQRVYEVQPGDAILTTYNGYASHVALYIGHDEILHHVYNQLSRREFYSRYWQDCTHSIWRHESWQPEMIQAILNDLEHSQ